MSQRELAEAVGYATKSSMNKIEAGETSVPIPRLTEIAKVLRVPLQSLVEEPSDDFIENGFKNEQEALANYAYNSTTDTAKKLRDHLVSAMKLLDQERGESEIEAKFNRLTPPNQKSVMDMIDFLLAQQKAPSVKGEGS
jgi:transcriptional regulator with XRE-family HTH domain